MQTYKKKCHCTYIKKKAGNWANNSLSIQSRTTTLQPSPLPSYQIEIVLPKLSTVNC